MLGRNEHDGREVLSDAFNQTLGTIISVIEMHEHSTLLRFESGLKIGYGLTGQYSYQEHSEKIPHEDRLRVFSMLSRAYGQPVSSLEIDDDYRLRLRFYNSLTLVLGDQMPDEVGYEQYDIYYEKFRFLFLSGDWDYWVID